MSKASDDVLAERQRQISVEGWTVQHDDQHIGEEMAMAAACYAMPPNFNGCDFSEARMNDWPWDMSWWKPKDRRTDLVRAAALLIAEIERLDRATPLGGKP